MNRQESQKSLQESQATKELLWTGRGALIFPGQGAQKKGMGQELVDISQAARLVFVTAEDVIPGITAICFEDPRGELGRTDVGQLASGVVDIAAAAALYEKYPQIIDSPPVVGAGISFGELPNLVVAGSIEFQKYLEFVRDRGIIMQEVGDKNPGRMIAVPAMREEEVSEICQETGVYPAIFYPGMTVISGSNLRIDRAIEEVRKIGGKPRETGVLYPFHTPLMEEARENIEQYLQNIVIGVPSYPVALSARGIVTQDVDEIREGLLDQITQPAYLPRTMAQMKATGAQFFIELCPQPVLSKFLERGNPEVTAISIHDQESLKMLSLAFVS